VVEVPGLKMQFFDFEFEEAISKFDLTLDGYESDGSLKLSFEYSTRLFKKKTIHRLAGYFKEIIRQVSLDKNIQLKDIIISHDFVDLDNNPFEDDQGNFGF
jgi:hydroxyacyl-ACP dehydratase HTD2-like protein with hotdog domain